jgi:hypothetical protein
MPTETVDLPSKGLLYPEGSELAKGIVEIKYMTAKEEDILTNVNYIKQGIVIDKLLQSLVVTKFDWEDLLIGDKNAILVAARILGYGKNYAFTYRNSQGQDVDTTVDLTTLNDKIIEDSLYTAGLNEFAFTLPHSDNAITFKLLTHGDEKKIEAEIKGLQKINPTSTYDVTTRLKHMITSVNGEREIKAIREFVDNYLMAKDARALREQYVNVQPDINMKFIPQDENYVGEGIDIPISLNFFWPDSGI